MIITITNPHKKNATLLRRSTRVKITATGRVQATEQIAPAKKKIKATTAKKKTKVTPAKKKVKATPATKKTKATPAKNGAVTYKTRTVGGRRVARKTITKTTTKTIAKKTKNPGKAPKPQRKF